jgi:signal transduction histidine kinase
VLLCDEPCVRVVVSDTGCGIPPEHRDQLFTPFFTTSAKGSGLGLSVVHGIVAEHRGSIEVSSVVGVGTAVTVTLPTASDASLPEGDQP